MGEAVKLPGIWHGFFDDAWHGDRPYDRHRQPDTCMHNIVSVIGRSTSVSLATAPTVGWSVAPLRFGKDASLPARPCAREDGRRAVHAIWADAATLLGVD